MRRYLPLIFFCFVCLGGCNKGDGLLNGDNRFLGKWTFDREYTQAHLPKETKSPSVSPAPKGSPSDAANTANEVNGILDNMVKPMLTEQLVGQMDGQTFTITPKLLTDSSGQSKTYQVIERPTANDMSIKLSDGTIWTATLEDGRIAIPTTGSVHFKLYFKQASQ